MKKPGNNDSVEEHLVYGMCQIADERKAKCIHCGSVWYEIHYKNGACNGCQQKGLHRIRVIDNSVYAKVDAFIAISIGLVVACAIYYLCSQIG